MDVFYLSIYLFVCVCVCVCVSFGDCLKEMVVSILLSTVKWNGYDLRVTERERERGRGQWQCGRLGKHVLLMACEG